MLLSEDGLTLINIDLADIPADGHFIFPGSVNNVANGVFRGCTGLAQVTFPKGLTEIDILAFLGCTGLKQVTFPEGLTEISGLAFYGCTGLTRVTFPEMLSRIGEQAFLGCIGLTQVTVPEGLTVIHPLTFSDCTGLTQVTFPEGLTEIGVQAFRCCTGLTRVTFPERLSRIGEQAFYGCTGLTQVTLPKSLTDIGGGAFRGSTDLRFIIINTQSEAEVNRIRALLPEDLQARVITKVDYEALSSKAEELRQKALERLCRAPQMHPFAKAISFFSANKASNISRLYVTDVICELNEWVGSNNPVYARAKQEMDALLLPRNESEFPAYQVQLNDILTRHGVLSAETAAGVEHSDADEDMGGRCSIS